MTFSFHRIVYKHEHMCHDPMPWIFIIVGKGPAVLAAGAGRVGYSFFYIFHLSSISYVLSFGRPLNMTEIL